jgi:N-methylhydantoinase A
MTTPVSVGLDIGGTFTDIVASEGGDVRVAKVPSTPAAYDEGVLAGVAKLGLEEGQIRHFSHGTTAAVNAILTKQGAETGLLTTKGFRDILEIRRGDREDLFNYWWRPPPPLVPRFNRLEARERIAFDGTIRTPLHDEDVLDAVEKLRARGVKSIAICFLNSFANPAHETRAKELVAASYPDAYVCTSADIVPEILEFERTSTTVANAYVGPLMVAYYDRILEALSRIGYRRDLLVMASSGDVMTLEIARQLPVATARSGIAAGVMAGAAIGRQLAISNLLTLDVGGTSSDVALVWNGRPRLTNEWEVEFGVPIRLRSVDVHTIGAGGGSIALVDQGSLLHVGPASAGAVPGPVAYGRGGQAPTVTDAQLVLGRLDVDRWRELYGWSLDTRGAERAIAMRIARPLGLGTVEAAAAMLEIMVNNLVEAIGLVSVKRGYDPRRCTLCAFGGAGPMYAVDVARALRVPQVVIPPAPGVTSALGLLQAEIAVREQRSLLTRQSAIDDQHLDEVLRTVEDNARTRLAAGGYETPTIVREADVRYFGQSRYLTIPMPDGPWTRATTATLFAEFEREHEREFGYLMPTGVGEPELVNVRAVAQAPQAQTALAFATTSTRPRVERTVYFRETGSTTVPVVDRAELDPGARLAGPALIEQTDSTVVVPPGAQAVPDRHGNLLVAT